MRTPDPDPRAAVAVSSAPAPFGRRFCSRVFLLCGLLPLGCGNPHDGDEHHDEPVSECSGDFDTYEAGMSRRAEPGAVTVELVESDPAPPVVRKDNAWWLQLSDAEGEPLLAAELLVTPYMPKHQHGSAEVVVEELGDGRYKLSPIELIMPGVWEIPVSITPPDGETSEMTFRFCIAER